MSQEVSTKQYPPDFSERDVDLLKKFTEDGLPGIKVPQDKIDKASEMYLRGSSYSTISNHLRIKREVVLYYSDRFKWSDIRDQKIMGMLESAAKQVEMIQLEHMNFVSEICNSIRTYYLDKANQYVASRDPSVMENINTSLMNLYLKCLESLSKGKDDKDKLQKLPFIGISLGQGATMTVEDSSSKETNLSAALKVLADINRSKDTN